jgi:hypothetical protein
VCTASNLVSSTKNCAVWVSFLLNSMLRGNCGWCSPEKEDSERNAQKDGPDE